jgi:hypothetical protein
MLTKQNEVGVKRGISLVSRATSSSFEPLSCAVIHLNMGTGKRNRQIRTQSATVLRPNVSIRTKSMMYMQCGQLDLSIGVL